MRREREIACVKESESVREREHVNAEDVEKHDSNKTRSNTQAGYQSADYY